MPDMRRLRRIADAAFLANMDEEFEIEVFKPGTFTPMNGPALTFTAQELSTVAEIYDFATNPAPAVVGHPKTDDPAFGWASAFRYDGERQRLIATVGDLAPAFADALKAKTYRKVSMAFHKPDAPANPKPGTWYPKHIGFLGGAAPAVPGLQPVSFSGKPDEAVVIEFGDPAFLDTASLFRRLRDWLIEQAGLEKADEVLPTYQIEWLSRQGSTDNPGFSAPTNKPESAPVTTNTPAADAAFAAREATLATKEKAIADREAAARSAENAAFAETLEKEGRLLPKDKLEVVGLLDALSVVATPIEASFADASGRPVKEPALETVKRLLKAMPKQVDFSAMDRGDPPNRGSAEASFAAPDGFNVDNDALSLHAKAVAYQATHPNTPWLDAVRAAQAGR